MFNCVYKIHRVQGVTRGSRFQRTGESFFYTSATDGMWVTPFFIIFSKHLQKIYSTQKTAIVKYCFDHQTCDHSGL